MKIKIENDKLVYDGKFIQTIERYFIDTNGNPGVWEMVRRKSNGRIVVIAAITAEKEIILEKHFRIPFRSYVIELPAGLMDRDKEKEEELARRELLEETGYTVDKLELLMAGPFNTGLVDDELAVYFGMNAHRIQEPVLEDSEDIEIIKVPLDRLFEFLSNPKDIKADIKIAAIIPFLKNKISFV